MIGDENGLMSWILNISRDMVETYWHKTPLISVYCTARKNAT